MINNIMVSKLTKEQEEYLIKHSTEKTAKEWMVFFNFKAVGPITKRLRDHKVKSKKPIKTLNQDARKNLSEKRKQWLKDNPDKHPWRRSNKFKSKPCESVKTFLKNQNIKFIEEYDPKIPEVNYSIDIAMPEKLIAIEINGNQHYNSDGSLKPYYQKRHDLLVSNGWEVHEIHYSHCFNFEKWIDFIDNLNDNKTVNDFNYFSYVRKEKTLKYCDVCSKQISNKSTRCKKHYKRKTKIDWPTPEKVHELIWKFPTTKIAEDLGVSDKAIDKFCKNNNITKPPRGYWAKLKSKS
jgi:hypothetical protein